MKKYIMMITAILAIFITGCEVAETPSADRTINRQTDRAMEESVRQTGLPAVKNWQEKKFMKMLYELRDQEGLICHAYLFNSYTGEVGQYLGKCVGYGIPYSTQYSNPQRLVDVTDFGISSYQANDSAVIPQPEPNGLFMPEGLSATWLMMLDEKGDIRPMYVEPEIIVSATPLH